jgi:hypothetical protein
MIALIYYIGEYFESIAMKNQSLTQAKRRFNEFYELEKNSLDMVYIGSSHSYCTFDPEIFDQALGTNSFQMGTPLQHPDTSYYVLREVLNHHQPKVVVFELYWDMMHRPFQLKQAEMVLEALEPESVLVEEYIREVFPIEEKVRYYIKALRFQEDVYAYFNQNLQEWLDQYRVKTREQDQEVEIVEGTEYYRSKGYIYADYIIPRSEKEENNQFNDYDAANWTFDPTQRMFVEKFIDLARANDIQVVLVTAPVANVSMEKIANYELIHNEISAFAQEQNLPYIDYNIVNMEENLLENENFRDDAHLNHSGVEIVDAHFIQWLLELGIF